MDVNHGALQIKLGCFASKIKNIALQKQPIFLLNGEIIWQASDSSLTKEVHGVNLKPNQVRLLYDSGKGCQFSRTLKYKGWQKLTSFKNYTIINLGFKKVSCGLDASSRNPTIHPKPISIQYQSLEMKLLICKVYRRK